MQTTEAERTLIGGVLALGELPLGADLIAPGDFEDAWHRSVWLAIKDLAESKEPIDSLTVSTRVGKGSFSRVVDLEESCGSTANLEHHGKLVRQGSRHRCYMRLLDNARLAADGNPFTDDAMQHLARDLVELADGRDSAKPMSMADMVKTEFQEMELRQRGEKTPGIRTGFKCLDDVLGGVFPGAVTVVTGGTGSGKSSAALGMLTNMASEGHKCLLFSMEMTGAELTQRAMASDAQVNLGRIIHGGLAESDYPRLSATMGRLHMMDLSVVDTPVDLETMQSITRQHAAKNGLDVLAVDYMQLVSGKQGRGVSREQEVSSVSRGIKRIAMELKIPVIALAQLNRQSTNRDEKRPRLSDLRESGAIEQDASQVIAIYHDPDDRGFAEFLVLKNRNGPVGSVRMRWLDTYTRFADEDYVR